MQRQPNLDCFARVEAATSDQGDVSCAYQDGLCVVVYRGGITIDNVIWLGDHVRDAAQRQPIRLMVILEKTAHLPNADQRRLIESFHRDHSARIDALATVVSTGSIATMAVRVIGRVFQAVRGRGYRSAIFPEVEAAVAWLYHDEDEVARRARVQMAASVAAMPVL